jgi:hypothetical protein
MKYLAENYLILLCMFLQGGLQKRLYICFWRDSPQWAKASSFTGFLDHTQWRTTVGRTPLDKWSARRRDLYLTTHSTNNRQTFGGIRTHNLSRRAAADLRLRSRGHWDRPFSNVRAVRVLFLFTISFNYHILWPLHLCLCLICPYCLQM